MIRSFLLPGSVPRTWRSKWEADIDWSVNIPGVQVGDYKFSTGIVDNNGWMLCDGRSLLRAEFPALFKKFGTAFGSNSIDTFKLPDCKGRVMAAVDGTRRALGRYIGEEEHILTVQEMPVHSHSGNTTNGGSHVHSTTVGSSGFHSHDITDPGHVHTQTTINDDFNDSGENPPSFSADSAGTRTWNNIDSATTGITINSGGDHIHTVTVQEAGSHSHAFTTGNAGSGLAHNNMQPTIFLGNMFVFSGRVGPVLIMS